MKLKYIIMSTISILLFIMAMNSSYADSSLARELVQQGEILPLEDIIAQVKTLHQGRILEVELEKKRQRLVYEIELITDKGIVWELYFDARTGQLIKSKQDD
ncbi:MAG: PepSY domain-containing protein [Gammaproteobacteria bacterium]|nr:PepSY domain-containing protein [Gammaproteobacteria bacterium]